MHAIKKAARREAWYQSDDESVKTYNFFGRTRTFPRKTRDEEAGSGDDGLFLTQTGNDAHSPVAEKRRQDNEDNIKGFEAPPKSDTFPLAPRPDGHSYTQHDSEKITSSEDSTHDAAKDVRFQDDQQPAIVEQSVGPQDGENKPRKRKLRKFLPWKKDESQEAADNQQDDTDDAKKNKFGQNITVMSQLKAVFGSWINLLLVFVPMGIAFEYSGINKVAVFVINFVAIIPLAGMLAYATEELALYIGEVLGGLLNASFGNAVELIVGIIALNQGKILIVQTSLIGSMLSNLLLVLGMCFFFGGLRRVEQFFNVTVAQTAASLLALATGSLVIPTAFKIFGTSNKGVAPLSRGTSVLLLITYACYLLFQLRTHVDIYNEPSQKAPKKPKRRKSQGEAIKAMVKMGGTSAGASGGQVNQELQKPEEEDGPETPQLTRLGALVTLAGSTVLVALCAEYMVSAIDAISGSVSPEFIGLILLPIVGNAAEHATAVTVAIKDKMDLAIGVCVGSSLQIALLVLPIMVMLNWFGVGKHSEVPMTLSFGGFQVVVLFIAVIVVNYLIQDGKSHWLEGVLLQMTYLIIAIAAWFYPTTQELA